MCLEYLILYPDSNEHMAVFLGVSKTALSIRLTQLGLVDKNYFGNPYDLTDIYCDGGI